jgi:hypothetical protein
MTQVAGSCRCGAVRLAVAGGVRRVVNCHCQLCRGMNGTAFSTYAVVEAAGLTVVAGRECVAVHAVTATAQKHWCARCGTPLYNTNPRYAGLAMLYLGILDGCATLVPAVNIYCSSKLPWVDQLQGAPSFDEGPPPRAEPVRPPAAAGQGDT